MYYLQLFIKLIFGPYTILEQHCVPVMVPRCTLHFGNLCPTSPDVYNINYYYRRMKTTNFEEPMKMMMTRFSLLTIVLCVETLPPTHMKVYSIYIYIRYNNIIYVRIIYIYIMLVYYTNTHAYTRPSCPEIPKPLYTGWLYDIVSHFQVNFSKQNICFRT